MYYKFSKLAELVSGYTFRESIQDDPKGDIVVLQAKNVQAGHDIEITTDFVTISGEFLRSPFLLQYNDIVLVSRGSGISSFRSALFTSNITNVMPSSSVHIIRIGDVTVLPRYACLYLNSEIGQKSLFQIVTGGSYIQTILLKNLRDLEIPVPPIHVQKSIISLHENIIAQDRIIKRKQGIQKNIINSAFTNIMNKAYDKK